jgi:glutamate racemase
MRVDLFAGAVHYRRPMTGVGAPTLLVFDSGVGGLTVLREVVRQRPDAAIVYAADDAGFPYGRLDEPVLVARVLAVMAQLIARHRPDLVIIACNTASTFVLPELRARFSIPFIGTVPAIKPAVEQSLTRHVAVLATPGTVKRDYTHALIARFAGDCRVTLVGSTALAGLAESVLRDEAVADEAIAAEIAPCFPGEGARTDAVVLGCTHYPLLANRFAALAPWPVTWIDPAPAIARRVVQLLGEAPEGAIARPQGGTVVFTSGAGATPQLRFVLAARGLPDLQVEPLPLVV